MLVSNHICPLPRSYFCSIHNQPYIFQVNKAFQYPEEKNVNLTINVPVLADISMAVTFQYSSMLLGMGVYIQKAKRAQSSPKQKALNAMIPLSLASSRR